MTKSDQLDEKIRKWLTEQGYPLEMKVAHSFRKAGFNVIQSDYYRDRDSGEQRETDVIASIQEDVLGFLVRITFVLECKSSNDKPWVFFTSPGSAINSKARVAQRVASEIGQKLLLKICDQSDVQDLHIFFTGDRPAYGVTQAFITGHDKTYSVSLSVSKAAYARAEEADKATQFQFDVCEIVFPIMVIDGRLFEAFLTSEDAPSVQEVDEMTLLWRNPIVDLPHTIIRSVTTAGLQTFVERCKDDVAELFKLIGPALNTVSSDRSDQVRRFMRDSEISKEK